MVNRRLPVSWVSSNCWFANSSSAFQIPKYRRRWIFIIYLSIVRERWFRRRWSRFGWQSLTHLPDGASRAVSLQLTVGVAPENFCGLLTTDSFSKESRPQPKSLVSNPLWKRLKWNSTPFHKNIKVFMSFPNIIETTIFVIHRINTSTNFLARVEKKVKIAREFIITYCKFHCGHTPVRIF